MRVKVGSFIFSVFIVNTENSKVFFDTLDGTWIAEFYKKKDAKKAFRNTFDFGFFDLNNADNISFVPKNPNDLEDNDE